MSKRSVTIPAERAPYLLRLQRDSQAAAEASRHAQEKAALAQKVAEMGQVGLAATIAELTGSPSTPVNIQPNPDGSLAVTWTEMPTQDTPEEVRAASPKAGE